MNKKNWGLAVVLISGMMACNNADKKHDGRNGSGDKPKTPVDSLLQYIDNGHIAGMSRMGKLHNTKKAVQAVIDSMAKLPVAAQQTASSYITSLHAVIKDLDNADSEMEKWMPEYYENPDTLADNVSERIKYLNTEKIKVDKIKEAILTSLQKADSLLKAKF